MKRYEYPTKTPNVWIILAEAVVSFLIGAGCIMAALAYFGVLWK